jgi:hypothetical protein
MNSNTDTTKRLENLENKAKEILELMNGYSVPDVKKAFELAESWMANYCFLVLPEKYSKPE